MRFRHSGKLGDIIYSLPAIRSCRHAALYLNVAGDFGLQRLHVEALLPLLRRQEYLDEVRLYEGEPFHYDLDGFRRLYPATQNLADCHLKLLGLSPVWRNEPWLAVPKREGSPKDYVVFARSINHHGIPGLWPACYSLLSHKAVFVGSGLEHGLFEAEFGPVPYAETRSFLDLATLIDGADLFVGNQSSPYAVAEGLKVPAIQETCVGTANCLFERANAMHVLSEADLPAVPEFVQRWVGSEASCVIGDRRSEHGSPTGSS